MASVSSTGNVRRGRPELGERGRLLGGVALDNSGALQCSYVDDTVLEARLIGAVHNRLVQHGSEVCELEAFLLHTCQRIELYSMGSPAPTRGHPLAEHAALVSGGAAVRIRLAEIAAGVRSELLGEWFVLRQVENAGDRLPAGHKLKPVVAEAVRLARRLRRVHDFHAAMDYPELAFSLLGQTRGGGDVALLVVGSGMLARAVLAHSAVSRYGAVVAVTRSPQRLRKRLARGAGGSVCNASQAWQVLAGRQWDAVIASTNVVEPYRSQLAELVEHPACRSAMDLSCVPLFSTTTHRFEHMYGPRFRGLLAKQNTALAERAARVQQAIASVYGWRR